MVQSIQDTYKLSNGVEMPVMGLGVYKNTDKDVLRTAVHAALDAGYRHIDTAAVYKNEAGVGEAVKDSGIPREELFITTKVWNTNQGYEETLTAFDESLSKLGLDYVDLYLVHWPMPGTYLETYRALETLYDAGKVRAIGVSNFHEHHLEELLKHSKVTPMVNQVEYHPHLPQTSLHTFCRDHGILLEAWAPLKRGGLFDDPVIQQLADKYGKSPAQVILRWDVQNGVSTIPKSVTPERIRENADIFDFKLTDSEMAQVDTLDNGERMGKNPDHVTLESFE